MKYLLLGFISVIITISSTAQLTKGNFFGEIGGVGFSNDNKLLKKYSIPDSLITSNGVLKINFGLNYALTNNISLGLHSNHVQNSNSTFSKNEYGPTLRIHFPINAFKTMKIYSNSEDFRMDDLIYLSNMLYFEGSALFGTVYHDSVSFNNKSYGLALGGLIRIPTSHKIFGRLGLSFSAGIKYHTRDNDNLYFDPQVKGGVVFYFDKKFNAMRG